MATRLPRIDPNVDYRALELALDEARINRPSDRYRVGLSNGEPYVECWTGTRATIYLPECAR